MNFFQKIKIYFQEVWVEIKKTNWPSMKENWRNVLIVVGASVVMAIFLGGLDFLFTWLIEKII